MNRDREKHLQSIKDEFVKRLDKKYRRGQAQHGKKVEDRDCLEEAMSEILDLSVYILCELNKRK